ncbi:MAG: YaeQ family protein [Gemmatimonadales bacterium]|nr:YaeQ family protein [Gemmatimonadales bacterium]
MAQTATIYNFDIDLSDVDRGVYEQLSLRVACQPSEPPEYLLTRVLAYCLEFTEGISFGKGLAEPGEPALTVRDLSGALLVWVEIGAPDAARLHKASQACRRVVVYTHKEPRQGLPQLAGERIHRVEALEIYSLDRAMLAELVGHLARRMAFSLSVSDAHLYLTVDGWTVSGAVERHVVAAA